MLAHEFILVKELPKYISIRDFDRSAMAVISDDFFRWHTNENAFGEIDTYSGSVMSAAKGFDYWGITTLTPIMSQAVLDVISRFTDFPQDCEKLTDLLNQAITENKYVIHFGV